MKKYTKEPREISFRDLLGFILSKWVLLLVLLLAGLILTEAYCFVNVRKSKSHVIGEEDLNSARSKLSVEQIEQVEYLYSQYLSYKEYRKALQDSMVNSFYTFSDSNDNTVKTVLYYVDSNIENVNQCFTRLAIGKSDYEVIAEVLGKSKDNLNDIYRRIYIVDLSANMSSSGETHLIIQENDNKNRKNSILQVTIVAQDKEHADDVNSIIKNAFDAELESLKSIDSNISLSLIGEQYTSDITSFLDRRQNETIEYLNLANNQISYLEKTYVETLDNDEKDYYDLMKEKDDSVIMSPKRFSYAKLGAIGAIIGLVIGLVIVVIIYVFNGKIKTPEDISERYTIDVPYTVFRKKKKGIQLFDSLVRKCRKVDLLDEAVRLQMVSLDIGIKLDKDKCDNAFLICDRISDWEIEIAERIKKTLKDRNNPINLTVGNPLSSPEELVAFSDSESVLLMAQLNESKENVIDKWIQLANRYDLKIIGAIILLES